jgi:SNF2 family DNA or RNA helicase
LISKFAVNRFLTRSLNSFRWMKKTAKSKLLKELQDITSLPIDSTIWKNQIVMMILGIYFPKFLFLVDMGGGKSRVSIDLIRHWKNQGTHCWLVCVPDKVNIQNWIDELEKFGSGLNWVVLDDPKTRKLDLTRKADVFIIHYPGLVRFACTLVPSKDGRAYRVHKPSLKSLQLKFDGLVLDECTAIGNFHSLTSRICHQIAKHCEYRYGLTGTPFGRDPEPLWNQFRVIDNGETLGPTLGLFRAAFYNEKRNYWGGMEYIFKKKMTNDLHRMIDNRSIVYSEGECSDLPERAHIPKTVILPDFMEPYYSGELKRIRKSKGDFREIQASFIRMRQLASGFLGIKNDETGAKAEIEFPENPKIETLLSIIEELPITAKMIIYYEFIWTGNRIARELRSKHIDHERLFGGQKDPKASYRRFREDPDCRLLLSNNKFSMGLNLQTAHYLTYVESPVRPIIRQQGERRIRRSGQTSDRVFIIDLIARSRGSNHSVDQKILQWLAEGKNLQRAILQGKATI